MSFLTFRSSFIEFDHITGCEYFLIVWPLLCYESFTNRHRAGKFQSFDKAYFRMHALEWPFYKLTDSLEARHSKPIRLASFVWLFIRIVCSPNAQTIELNISAEFVLNLKAFALHNDVSRCRNFHCYSARPVAKFEVVCSIFCPSSKEGHQWRNHFPDRRGKRSWPHVSVQIRQAWSYGDLRRYKWNC